MEIVIEPLRYEDAEDLFNFECKNRMFFEKMVPSRGEEYYDFDTFMIKHMKLLDEQKQGLSYFYLIKKTTGEILGRMNFVDVDQSKNLGHLGYRVGQKYAGQGIAKKALGMLMEHVKENGFTKVLAKTIDHNIASQKVLERDGFKRLETSGDEFVMLGETVKFVKYAWVID
ncbi:GNAT family N-acetyltransferase [Halobacillus faecis]|uniref:N-acetyltransferase n=1 Tax=Halobacillus faecis TaxID=360184 RepID=A0A511WR31_9BACI|nr:GNAT family N-acetyltransferase [Halobacillus faecis]GEN52693.1 N-acetyltransferase [Halobacillus faecis]